MSIYENNLRILKSKFPEVYDWIQKEGEDEGIEIIRTKSGLSNLRFKGLPGEQICLYGMDNPLEEEIERCKDKEFLADRNTFLIGIGLGYILDVIKKKISRGHKIIVFEHHAAALKKALTQTDVVGLLQDDALVFSLPDGQSLKETIPKNTPTHVNQVEFLWGSPRGLELKKEYVELKERVFKISSQAMSYVRTMVKGGNELAARNEIENIPKFSFSPGIKNLFNLFEKIPGIIISAGPSLERNIHLLREGKGKALLLATAPVVRILLAYDIQPDLMISVDFAEGNSIHFEGLWDGQGIPLIHSIALASRIVRDFQGDTFAFQCEDGWLSDKLENKGILGSSGSVAGMALKAAIAFGCDPIIFVGQDLCYSDKTHIEGSARSRKFDRIQQGEEVYWAEGVYGQPVLTSERFISFLHDIEETIAPHERKFINATASGLRIRGTEEVPLQESINRWCGKMVDAGSIIQRSRVPQKIDFAGLVNDLKAKKNEIKDTLDLCLKGLNVNKNIKKNLKMGLINTPIMNALVHKNELIAAHLQTFYDSFRPLRLILGQYSRQATSPEFMCRNDYSQEKNLTLYVERNQFIFSAIHRALKELSGGIFNLFTLMEKIKSSRDELEICPADGMAHYQYGKVLAEIGLHCLAVEEYRKALELGKGRSSLYEDLGKSYYYLGEFRQAKEYFKQAQERGKNPERVLERLKEIEEELNQSVEKAGAYLREGNWVMALLYSRKVIREIPHCQQAQRIEEAAIILRDEKVARMEAAREKEKTRRGEQRQSGDLMARGKRLFIQRKFPAAVEALQEALRLGCDPVEGERALALCYSEMGDVNEAQKILEGLSSRYPDAGLYSFSLGRVLLRNGDLMGAAGQMEMAAEKEKKYYVGLFEAGTIYMKMSKYDRAIGCFERYLEMSPDSYEILGKIGTCYLAQGKLPKAKEKYRQALQISPAYKPALLGLQKIEEMEERSGGISTPNLGPGLDFTKERS